jgi:hypothetical protein
MRPQSRATLRNKGRRLGYPAALRMTRIAFELPQHPFGWPLDAITRELGISERTLKRYWPYPFWYPIRNLVSAGFLVRISMSSFSIRPS